MPDYTEAEQRYQQSVVENSSAAHLLLRLYERLQLVLRSAQAEILLNPLACRQQLLLAAQLLQEIRGFFSAETAATQLLQHQQFLQDIQSCLQQPQPNVQTLSELLEQAQQLEQSWRQHLQLKRRSPKPDLNVRRKTDAGA